MLGKEAGTDDELVVERGCQDTCFSTHRGIDFQVRLSFTLLGGILADAMGYGKTLLAVALTAMSCREQLREERNGRPSCSPTLVVVPEHLVYQWLTEFKKALGDVVEVRLFGGTNSSSAAEPQSHSDQSSERALVFAAASVEGWLELMEAPWTESLALVIPYSLLHSVEPWLTLHRYHWRRLIVDELHEALGHQTMADALSMISAQHVWGLSGTLPAATAADVARLAALFGVSIPVDAMNAGRFLDCYVRRNDAVMTDRIPMDEHCHVVQPTSMERAIYLACQHDFDEPTALEASRSYVPAFLSTWRGLQEHGREAALVKLCCHHEVTSSDIELLSTPAQSVERLCTWKRHHCEEARRLVRRRAFLAEWMWRNSVSGPHAMPSQARVSMSDQEAWNAGTMDFQEARGLSDEALLAACTRDLESMPFALCDRPGEAEARWLEWCRTTGLLPGTPGAISRLRKIMYDELWGRLLDGQEGWTALAKMSGRDWCADYAAAQQCRFHEAMADFAAALRSASFLESVVRQAEDPGVKECGICLQALRSPHLTPCAHIFCAACILRSLETKSECPQCREQVKGPGQLSALIWEGGSNSEALPFGRETHFGSKISALVKCLQDIRQSGEKAVVFAQWQDLIFKIHAALLQYDVPAAVLAGGAFDRASVLQRFESPELPVLLLSLEDSASGTNMAHASHVLLVHPMVASSASEQRAYEAQAIGRVRRWGQRRRVQVWRYIMRDTIEEDLAVQRSTAHGSGSEAAAAAVSSAT